MKNSLSLFSVCLLFLALGVRSCKKDYVCHCTYSNTTTYESFSFIIKDTKDNAKQRCYDAEHNWFNEHNPNTTVPKVLPDYLYLEFVGFERIFQANSHTSLS